MYTAASAADRDTPGANSGAAVQARRMSQVLGGLDEETPVGKETFTKADRIRSKRDFERLKRSGIRLSDGIFLLVVVPTDVGYPRLGIAVPKRIGSAVVRNRIKRLIRETFRLNRESLPGSIDLLVVVRRTPDPLTFGEFRNRILSLVTRYQAMERTQRPVPDGEFGG